MDVKLIRSEGSTILINFEIPSITSLISEFSHSNFSSSFSASSKRITLEVRISELYKDIAGETSLLSAHKKVTLHDRHDVIASFEVIEPLRDLLLENNPESLLEVEVIPPHPRFTMTIRNPQAGSWIMIGAGVRPYACPLFPSGRDLSAIEKKALQYRETVKGDDSVVADYYNAKKLIGAIKQIAAFDNKLQV